MTRRAVRLSLVTVGVFVGAIAVLALREATLSTHQPVAPSSLIELVVAAKTKGGEPTQTVAEMTEAQLLSCRLEVNSDLVGPLEGIGQSRFRAVLSPSLDHTDRRQFRGCLESWMIDHFQLDVIRLADYSR
ncbi:MAG: hypothetical protein M3378_10400 [Actinomycetota bacterium]|nr:hypothetical protein [Actinomycetota bacterium]